MTDVDVAESAADGGPSDPGTDPPATRPGLLRRWWWLLVLLLVAVAVAVVVLVVSGDDDGDAADDAEAATERDLPTPPPPVSGGIDAEGQELLDLLEAGNERTYHASYAVTGDPDVIGDELRIDVWRRDGAVRQDLHQVTANGTVDTASFISPDGEVVGCQRIDEGAWTCALQSAGDEFTEAGLFGTLARELEGADVTATDDTVADRDARCFTVARSGGEESQCMSLDGIPLSRVGGGAELVLDDLSEDVPDDIFTPPAEPVAPGE